MLKIAIPVIDGKLHNHFGQTNEFYLFEVKDGIIKDKQILKAPKHGPGAFPKWLADKGVTDIIAGGMGLNAISIFNQNKINVFIGVPQKTPYELADDFVNGILETHDNVTE